MHASALGPDEVSSHQPFLARLARSLVQNREDADDLVQEVWISALEQPPNHFVRMRGWLRAAAVHAASRRIRREKGRLHREKEAARSESLPSVEESFERESFLGELFERAMALEDPYREVLRLRFLEDLSPHSSVCSD